MYECNMDCEHVENHIVLHGNIYTYCESYSCETKQYELEIISSGNVLNKGYLIKNTWFVLRICNILYVTKMKTPT